MFNKSVISESTINQVAIKESSSNKPWLTQFCFLWLFNLFCVLQVRDELEHLLDDDEDMAEMYLTEKLLERLENSSTYSMNDRDDLDDEVLQSNNDDR